MPLTSTDPLVLIALAAAIIALLLTLVAVWRQAALLKRYRMLLQSPAGMDMEQVLLAHGADLDRAGERLTALEAGLQRARTEAESHLQHVGVVRFSAFPDVGSDLSYAVAVLDGHRNGVVLASLYGRNECRVYAKPIRNGTSTYTLTDEEKDALAQALQTTPS